MNWRPDYSHGWTDGCDFESVMAEERAREARREEARIRAANKALLAAIAVLLSSRRLLAAADAEKR